MLQRILSEKRGIKIMNFPRIGQRGIIKYAEEWFFIQNISVGLSAILCQYPCFIALLYFPFQPNATHLRFKAGERWGEFYIASAPQIIFREQKFFLLSPKQKVCSSGDNSITSISYWLTVWVMLIWDNMSDRSLRKMLLDLLANFYFLSARSKLCPYMIFFIFGTVLGL